MNSFPRRVVSTIIITTTRIIHPCCHPTVRFSSFLISSSSSSSSLLLLPHLLRPQVATLATKSNPNNNNNNNNNNKNKFLINEALVQAIRKRARNISPHDIQVRLLMNQQPQSTSMTNSTNASTTTTTQQQQKLLSLPEAVQLSVQHKLDLIGISLQQDIPVIRMDHWNSFWYKQEKEQSMKQQSRKATKEVHLQQKIAPHDLERKIQQVTKFLDKGHICVLKMPLVLLDPVLKQLPSRAELMHPPQIEGQKALIRVHAK